MPEYVQSGAGDYPFSGAITRAIAEFVEQRPNICVGWTFHNNGGMYLRGPSSKAQGEYPRQDIAVYDYLGQQAERITPGYRYMISWKDLYPDLRRLHGMADHACTASTALSANCSRPRRSGS